MQNLSPYLQLLLQLLLGYVVFAPLSAALLAAAAERHTRLCDMLARLRGCDRKHAELHCVCVHALFAMLVCYAVVRSK